MKYILFVLALAFFKSGFSQSDEIPAKISEGDVPVTWFFNTQFLPCDDGLGYYVIETRGKWRNIRFFKPDHSLVYETDVKIKTGFSYATIFKASNLYTIIKKDVLFLGAIRGKKIVVFKVNPSTGETSEYVEKIKGYPQRCSFAVDQKERVFVGGCYRKLFGKIRPFLGRFDQEGYSELDQDVLSSKEMKKGSIESLYYSEKLKAVIYSSISGKLLKLFKAPKLNILPEGAKKSKVLGELKIGKYQMRKVTGFSENSDTLILEGFGYGVSLFRNKPDKNANYEKRGVFKFNNQMLAYIGFDSAKKTFRMKVQNKPIRTAGMTYNDMVSKILPEKAPKFTFETPAILSSHLKNQGIQYGGIVPNSRSFRKWVFMFNPFNNKYGLTRRYFYEYTGLTIGMKGSNSEMKVFKLPPTEFNWRYTLGESPFQLMYALDIIQTQGLPVALQIKDSTGYFFLGTEKKFSIYELNDPRRGPKLLVKEKIPRFGFVASQNKTDNLLSKPQSKTTYFVSEEYSTSKDPKTKTNKVLRIKTYEF